MLESIFGSDGDPVAGQTGPIGPIGLTGPTGPAGTNGSDATVNLTNVAAVNHSASIKSSIIDADEVTGQDSANSFSLIRTTWTSIKAFLKTYFDGIYQATGSYITSLTTSTPTNLTGFIKGNGSVLSADNSTYLKAGTTTPSTFRPTNPTTTNSASYVMMGLGSTIYFTTSPSSTGKIRFTISYYGVGTGASAAGETKVAYGIGNAPANGSAATGTVEGGAYAIGSSVSIGLTPALVLRSLIITGLSQNTAYWFDIQVEKTGGNTIGPVTIESTIQELSY